MPTAPLYNVRGEKVGELNLPDGVFGVPVHKGLLHESVVMQLASRRQGTAATKTIGYVSGGGVKPWRQKGTGRARHGSRRSPLWPGGATLFGPQPRDYGYRLPRKARRLALKSALSAKMEAGELIIVDDFNLEAPKTRTMVGILNGLDAGDSALVVTAEPDVNITKSVNNIPGVATLPVEKLNVYDILAHKKLLMTRSAVSKLEEVLAQ
ncbi:MAG TPA: 50S ribosomal protein L4 [Firmicutes bacterium]|nr:50S ribosomal protein L4 [Bacillota bacterium]